MAVHLFGGRLMEYTLLRSRRKTLAVSIQKDGCVEVRAPYRMPLPAIERFLESKKDWIEEKAGLAKRAAEKRERFRIAPGSTLRLAGREYPVLPGEGPRLADGRIYVPDAPFEEWKPELAAFLKQLAQEEIARRTAWYAAQMGVQPASVRIGRSNTSWGTCSGKNGLNFTWKLIFAEPEVLDYVVVHELAHIREHNHSARFWRVVESVLPDWRERRAKLKPLQQKLAAEAWD